MDSLPLSPSAVRAAREALGMSQARLAATVGINRTYLCQFENGRRILREDEVVPLVEFFDAQEIDLAGDPELLADSLTDRNLPAKACAERGYEVRDGFVIPAELVADRTELILEEIQSIRERAHALWRQEIPQSWFALADDESEALSELRELALRFFALVEELQGGETFAHEVASLQNTIASRVANLDRA